MKDLASERDALPVSDESRVRRLFEVPDWYLKTGARRPPRPALRLQREQKRYRTAFGSPIRGSISTRQRVAAIHLLMPPPAVLCPPSSVFRSPVSAAPRRIEQRTCLTPFQCHQQKTCFRLHKKDAPGDNTRRDPGLGRSSEDEGLWPIAIGWLQSCRWYYLPDSYMRIAGRLIEKGKLEHVLAFLQIVLWPMALQNTSSDNTYFRHDEAVGRFNYHELEKYLRPLIEAMESQEPLVCVPLLEGLLSKALIIESDLADSDFCKTGYWRAAIEDHERNVLASHHKDLLLVALRDTLENCLGGRSAHTREVVVRYLNHEWDIFRKLGLHLVRKAEDKYIDLAVGELTKADLLDDSRFHHEVMLLLRDTFRYMEGRDQQRLIAMIRNGPDETRVRELAESAKKRWPGQVDVDEYCRHYAGRWIRTRLQVISDGLTGANAAYYEKLVSEYGVSEHPDFLSPASRASYVRRVAPESAGDWDQMSAEKCVDLMITWEAEPQGADFLKRVCPKGLADLFKESLKDRWGKFLPHLRRLIEEGPYPYRGLCGTIEAGS